MCDGVREEKKRAADDEVAIVKLKYAVPLGALLLVAVYSGGFETYCVFWPGIETNYAPGYSERHFKRVEVGMTNEQVIALLGHPLRTEEFSTSQPSYRNYGEQVWSYTREGSWPLGDWAWLSREVVFSEGHVARLVSRTYYD